MYRMQTEWEGEKGSGVRYLCGLLFPLSIKYQDYLKFLYFYHNHYKDSCQSLL